MPANPVHRSLSGAADGSMRYQWLQAIFSDDPRIRVVDWEIRRGCPTASIETLRQFAQEMPDETPWLMLGADTWAELPSWREYPEHLELCNIAVFARHGIDMAMLADWKNVDIDKAAGCRDAGHVVRVEVELPDISATTIRAACSRGVIPDGMIPNEIKAQVIDKYRACEAGAA